MARPSQNKDKSPRRAMSLLFSILLIAHHSSSVSSSPSSSFPFVAFVNSFSTYSCVPKKYTTPPSKFHLPMVKKDDNIESEASREDGDESWETIRQKLKKMQADLLLQSDSTSIGNDVGNRDGVGLQPLSSSSSSCEERSALSIETIIRENILSSRLSNLNLDKTRVDVSTLAGAGRGLFATVDIAKGDVITCYPGDALLCTIASSNGEDEEDYDLEDEDFDLEYNVDDNVNEDEEEEDWVEEIVLWGTHISEENRLDEDTVFDGIQHNHDSDDETNSYSLPPLTDNALAVCDKYSVIGMPSLDSDPAYVGHFANDGAGHLASSKSSSISSTTGIEEGIASYVLESIALSNAMHQSLDDLHMVTVALKDIQAGEEIFVTYGPDYWMENSGNR